MIFKQITEVLNGTKTQTRRVCKPNERLLGALGSQWVDIALPGRDLRKWVVGRTYAAQPGRGKKAVGRIRITGIRQERLQDIDFDDALAEGCRATLWEGEVAVWPQEAYCDLWQSINGKGSWDANPLVWVLEFEVAP